MKRNKVNSKKIFKTAVVLVGAKTLLGKLKSRERRIRDLERKMRRREKKYHRVMKRKEDL